MKTFSAIALAVLIVFSTLTEWVPARWPVSAAQLAIFAIGTVWALRILRRPDRFRKSSLLLLLACMLAWGLLQLALHHSVYSWQTRVSVLSWAANGTLFFAALQTFADSRLRHRFLHAILIFGFVLSIVSTLQLFTSAGKVFWIFPSGYTSYVLGPFVNHNIYASFIEMVLPVGLFRALTHRGAVAFYLTVVALMYASVLACASRAGFALVSLEVIVTGVVALSRGLLTGREFSGILAAVLACIAISTTAIGWSVLSRRFQDPNIYAVRGKYLRSSLRMIEDRPGMGFGLGSWPTVYPEYASFDNGRFANYAHNDWAQWTVEGGIPFLILMIALLARLAYPAILSIWCLGAVMLFLHSFVDDPIRRPAIAVIFFIFLGILEASRQKTGRQNTGKS